MNQNRRGRPAERRDSLSGLGQPLGRVEEKIYLLIFERGLQSIYPLDIYKEVSHCENIRDEDQALNHVFAIISRIRNKLGETAIITTEDGGFVARRALIESDHFKNKETF